MSDLRITPVNSKKEKNDFLLLPWDIYENDPNWVPPLLLAVKESLDTNKNPFYKHAKIKLWNAYRGDRCVGRIAGVVDDRHNEFHQEKTGFWGFFECENNQETANALFEAASEWVKAQDMTVIRGPMSPSTNHECGLQISAFETKPYIMMTQNPKYYLDLVENAGHGKAKDLYAWEVNQRAKISDRLKKRFEKLSTDNGVVIRPINMKDYEGEVDRILEIYNDAWEKNWGFVPMNEEEFRHMAKDMKAIVDPEMLFMVEVKGEMAGFGLFLPDLNIVMDKIRNGRLFPTGLLKLLWYTKVRRRATINRGRILTLGVKKRFQPLGLGALMYLKYFEMGKKLGYDGAECSWILEDNKQMNRALELMGAKNYKTYRIYDKPLT